jgi:soluble lytic murein transglycosylase-like protein
MGLSLSLLRRIFGVAGLGLLVSACSMTNLSALAGKPVAVASPATTDGRSTPEINALVVKYAATYNVPESLIHRMIIRESGYNPGARNGPYWGLMQILPATARTMGYRGEAAGLLNADTNLKYAVRYLAGAYLVAGGNADAAVGYYARGYYYDAKRMGLLEETGLR